MLPFFEGLPVSTDRGAFLAKLNAQGARGFRFFSGLGFGSGSTSESVEAYVKDAPTTYVFELLDPATTVAAMQSQLNSQGARGFQWAGPYSVDGVGVVIYRRDASSTTTYSYNLQTATDSSADFVAQANNLGASGYYNIGSTFSIDNKTIRIYEKATTNALYAVEVLAQPASDSEFFAQLNAQGARGFRFKTPFGFSDGARMVYEKDTTQTATFVFYGLDPATSGAAFVQKANAEGQKGSAFVGDYGLPSNSSKTLYVTPGNCSGFLCQTRNFFGF